MGMLLTKQRADPRKRRSGVRLFRNTVWSCVGSAAPMLMAVPALPLIIRGIGTDRFGILSLAWMAIGYLSLLDFGIGRAITRFIADRIAKDQRSELPSIFWDANLLLVGVGLAGGVLVWFFGGLLVDNVLKIPKVLHAETLICFRIIAITIPFVVLANGMRGFLEAHQRFAVVNIARTLIGISGFIGPLFLIHYSPRVDLIVGLLSLLRFSSVIIFSIACVRACPGIRTHAKVGTTPVGQLLRFGGWITFDNLIGPLMISIDRFIISGVLSVEMVAFYATPQEIATKVLVLPMGLQQAIFPAFSGIDRAAASSLYRKSIDSILLAMLPICVLLLLFGHDILNLWLGTEFANRSAAVLAWLSLGILINSLAHVPSSMIQAIGRPEINAIIHFAELPVYVVAAWWAIVHFGIVGAAVAWVLRVAVDAICFFAAAHAILPCRPFKWLHLVVSSILIGISAFVGAHATPFGLRWLWMLGTAVAVLFMAFPIYTRHFALQDEVAA